MKRKSFKFIYNVYKVTDGLKKFLNLPAVQLPIVIASDVLPFFTSNPEIKLASAIMTALKAATQLINIFSKHLRSRYPGLERDDPTGGSDSEIHNDSHDRPP